MSLLLQKEGQTIAQTKNIFAAVHFLPAIGSEELNIAPAHLSAHGVRPGSVHDKQQIINAAELTITGLLQVE